MSSYADKRSSTRHRRRLRVSLGGAPIFTADVSSSGLCAEMARVLKPGSEVKGNITLENKEYPFVGQVMWVKPGDPQLGIRGKMGIRFSQIADEFTSNFERMFGKD
jgi:PilZ domain